MLEGGHGRARSLDCQAAVRRAMPKTSNRYRPVYKREPNSKGTKKDTIAYSPTANFGFSQCMHDASLSLHHNPCMWNLFFSQSTLTHTLSCPPSSSPSLLLPSARSTSEFMGSSLLVGFPSHETLFLTLTAVISQAIKRSKGRTEGQNRRGAKKTRAVFAQPYSPMFGFYGATPGPLEVEVANLRSSTRAPRITFSKGSRRPSELLNPDPCYSPRNKGSICHAHFVHKNSQYSH